MTPQGIVVTYGLEWIRWFFGTGSLSTKTDDLTAIVKDAVARNYGLVASFSSLYSRNDLEQDALMALHRALPGFDASRSKLSTFVNTIVQRKAIDASRSLTRRRNRDHIGAANNPEVIEPEDDTEAPENLKEWLGSIYRTIRRNFTSYGIPLRPKQAGQPSHCDRAQAAALLAMKKKLKKSSRGMEKLLRDRPELLAAIDLKESPAKDFFVRVEKYVSVINFRPLPPAATI